MRIKPGMLVKPNLIYFGFNGFCSQETLKTESILVYLKSESLPDICEFKHHFLLPTGKATFIISIFSMEEWVSFRRVEPLAF